MPMAPMSARRFSQRSDKVALGDFERLHRLSKARFEEEVLGPVNRLNAFSESPSARHARANHERVHFDWAIEAARSSGLAATRGSKITEATAGSRLAMLTDLWQAAMARGNAGPAGSSPSTYTSTRRRRSARRRSRRTSIRRGASAPLSRSNQMLSQFESYGAPTAGRSGSP
jgi:hypothetical protein